MCTSRLPWVAQKWLGGEKIIGGGENIVGVVGEKLVGICAGSE